MNSYSPSFKFIVLNSNDDLKDIVITKIKCNKDYDSFIRFKVKSKLYQLRFDSKHSNLIKIYRYSNVDNLYVPIFSIYLSDVEKENIVGFKVSSILSLVKIKLGSKNVTIKNENNIQYSHISLEYFVKCLYNIGLVTYNSDVDVLNRYKQDVKYYYKKLIQHENLKNNIRLRILEENGLILTPLNMGDVDFALRLKVGGFKSQYYKEFSKSLIVLQNCLENTRTVTNNRIYFHDINKTKDLHNKNINHFGDYYKGYRDYFGNSHKEYGGTLTDLRTLDVGTNFYVCNGYWHGTIEENELGQKVLLGQLITEENCGLYLILDDKQDGVADNTEDEKTETEESDFYSYSGNRYIDADLPILD